MRGRSADFDALLRANLESVFNQRDPARRAAAIAGLYAADAMLYEPDSAVSGHHAIGHAVEALLARLPAHFAFAARGPAVGHHGLARLHWQLGPPGGPASASGTDVARIERGLIRALHVFLDPPEPA